VQIGWVRSCAPANLPVANMPMVVPGDADTPPQQMTPLEASKVAKVATIKPAKPVSNQKSARMATIALLI
jgi:hypothetical protein